MEKALNLFSQPSLEVAKQQRDTAMVIVQANAGVEFSRKARAFFVRYLALHGEVPGETLTDQAKAMGILPVNGDRAFGPVVMSLLRANIIEKAGTCVRRKGHSSDGGKIYRLKPTHHHGPDVSI